MTERSRDELVAKNLPLIAVVAVALGVTVVRLRFGWPAVLLWLAFCALSGAILLFWESLRAALDPEARGDDNDLDLRAQAQAELEERKRAALRALRDVREEHALGKLSDDDFRDLEARYRAEARAVLQKLDDLLGDHLARAEAEFDRIAAEASTPAAAEGERGASRERADGRDLEAQRATDAAQPGQDAPRLEDSSAQPGARAAVSFDPSQSPVATVIEGSSVRVCGECRTVNDPDARFCKKCGAKVEDASS